jgi:hypothetical protein
MATKKATKKSAAKKSSVKKAAAKKSPAKKSPAKKAAPKKTAAKKSARKYSPTVSKQVQTELHEMHEGKLKSGGSGNKVTNPKQAIAIALSEACKSGAKVPPNLKD